MKHLYTYRRSIVVAILLTGFVSLFSQETVKTELMRSLQQADISFYNDQDYEKAATLYEPIYEASPDNHNLAAKLGISYLNMDGRREKALELLKLASENIAVDEKEYKENGNKAPVDTWFYLAIAYHRNDSLEKAIATFTKAKQSLTGDDPEKEEYIDLQIRDCRHAMEMKKQPMRVLSDLFVPWLENYPGACNPVIARNDSVFVFTVKQAGKTKIYCSYKTEGTWGQPSDITPQIGVYDRLYSNSITGNGRMLILFMDDGDDGNLYYSERSDTIWTRIKNVGRNVNSIYWEAHGFITPDGNTMYFSSNRPGGQGELDIWTAERNPDGSWRVPDNLGGIVNTPYDEDTPYFDTEEQSLIFSSTGHISMGDFDIFRSTRRGGGWTQPVGMPYAFNNVAANTHFITNHNGPGFIASRYDENTQTRNIFALVAVNPADEITKASGMMTLGDGLEVDPAKAELKVINIADGKEMLSFGVKPDGSFSFDIKPGEYQVLATYPGYNTDTVDLSLPLYFMGSYLTVNPSLLPEKVSSGDFISIQNVLFDFDSYSITEEASRNLEALRRIMEGHPELKVEVAGYTDALGSTEYNRRLADRRAQAVIDFLSSAGIESSRFVKKAFGESNFAAINTNPDGSDNPEGRQFNRRATFGIVNPNTGVVIRKDVYTPEHLRLPHSMRYSIVLKKTPESLTPEYFEGMISNEALILQSIRIDNDNVYALGVFYNMEDAVTYLTFLKEKGLKDAFIVNQYDLDNGSVEQIPAGETAAVRLRRVFTVQLKATKAKLDIPSVFPGIEGVREVYYPDGFYRYYKGEFRAFSEARKVHASMVEIFDDAFIKEIEVE